MRTLACVAVALAALVTPMAVAKSNGRGDISNPDDSKPLPTNENKRLTAENELAGRALEYLGKPINRKTLCSEAPKKPSICDDSLLYRSADGTCNNQLNPSSGARLQSYRRLAGYSYGDDFSSFRQAVNGGELPNARLVSLAVDNKPPTASAPFSLLLETFGRLLFQDLVNTPQVVGSEDEAIQCCPKTGRLPGKVHSECASIRRSARPFAQTRQTCMEFVRSAMAPRCESGPRDQMNEATAYLDGSWLYGGDQQEMASRRTSRDGQLRIKVSKKGVEQFPPQSDAFELTPVFRTVHILGNAKPAVAALSLTFARYHNYVAQRLKTINPSWNDEELFQESRRVVIAQLQHVTYSEYLHKILGKAAMDEYQLTSPKGELHSNDYDPGLDVATSSEFATVALLFSNGPISNHIERLDSAGIVTAVTVSAEASLEDVTEAPSELLRGVSRQGASTTDFTKEISAILFPNTNPVSLDLAALNIQRGRDHGVPGYTAVRKVCGDKVETFQGLADAMDQAAIDILQRDYRDVKDVDFYVGGALERPVAGGLLGRTFTCVLAEQFSRIRKGDRFWYETSNKDSEFEDDQLRALKNTTLAGIMCGAFPDLQMVQPKPFEVVSAENPLVSCDSLPSVDFAAWKPKKD